MSSLDKVKITGEIYEIELNEGGEAQVEVRQPQTEN